MVAGGACGRRPGHDAHGRRPVRLRLASSAPSGRRGDRGSYDIFFLETPLWTDDLDGYARARGGSPVPIAAGEWLSSRHEFPELIDRGRCTSLQPDIGRVGGFTEARRVCDMAARARPVVVPHAWKTGISVAAAAHLATVTPHMPFFEFLPAELCESRLAQGPDGRRARLRPRQARAPVPSRPRRRAQPHGAARVRRGGGACRLTCVPRMWRMRSTRWACATGASRGSGSSCPAGPWSAPRSRSRALHPEARRPSATPGSSPRSTL